MSLAFLFPGQGSAEPGMGRALVASSPAAAEVFARADRALGWPLSALCFSADAATLILTENQQPAVLAVSLASLAAYRERGGPEAAFACGHSLGEYAALVSAGALALEDAVRLVALRGRFMQEAVPAGQGTMTAVLGLATAEVEDLCAGLRARGESVWVANHNGGGQVVVSGLVPGVEAAAAAAQRAGAKRIVPLRVSAPFHTPLMRPAADRLFEALVRVTWSTPRFPVPANVDALPHPDAASIPERLARQVTSPVLWEGCVRYLIGQGMTATVEMEPGRVLSGLVKHIDPAIERHHAADE